MNCKRGEGTAGASPWIRAFLGMCVCLDDKLRNLTESKVFVFCICYFFISVVLLKVVHNFLQIARELVLTTFAVKHIGNIFLGDK
jgi:membrane associated rhomboid family serine protease